MHAHVKKSGFFAKVPIYLWAYPAPWLPRPFPPFRPRRPLFFHFVPPHIRQPAKHHGRLPVAKARGRPCRAPQADGLAAWRRGWSRGDVMFLARCARSRKVAYRHITDRGRDRRLGRPRAVPDQRQGEWCSVMSCVGATLGKLFPF